MTDGAGEGSSEPEAVRSRIERESSSGPADMTPHALEGAESSRAMAQVLKGMDTSRAMAQVLKGMDTSRAMAHMIKGVDTSSSLAHMIKGVDTSSSLAHMIKGMDTSSSLAHMIKGMDTSSSLAHMIKGLGTIDLVTRVVGGGFSGPSMRSEWYDSTARHVLADLGLLGPVGPDVIRFTPSYDDSAYAVLEAQAPDVAQAISAAAERVTSPFWSKSTVRNSLGWLVATVVVILYVGGTVLWFPWGAVVVALLSSGGVTAPNVYRGITKGDGPSEAD